MEQSSIPEEMVLEECMTWTDIKGEAHQSGQPLINSDNTLLPMVLCSLVNNQRALRVSRFISRPRCCSGKRTACQCRKHKRHGFDPWVGKIPWRRKWQTALVFLPQKCPWIREPDGLHTVHGVSESDTTEQLSTHEQVL